MRFNNLIGLALLLALLAGCTAAPTKPGPAQAKLPEQAVPKRHYSPQIEQLYRLAMQLLKQQRTEQGQALLEHLLTLRADIPGAWYNLGRIQYQQGELNQAEASLARCLEYHPRYAPAYTLQGVILRQRGEFEQARVAYSKAVQSDPDYPQAHLNLGILYDIYLQYLEDARHHYQRFLALNPDPVQAEQVQLWLQDVQLRLQQGGNS